MPFNALAANVVASVHKGQPVGVHGRLRINSWATTEGRSMISVEVDAHTVGHDLTKGQSLFSKPVRAQFDPTDRMGAPEVQASLAALETPDFEAVSYTHLRAHETVLDLVCRLLLEKKKKSLPTNKST